MKPTPPPLIRFTHSQATYRTVAISEHIIPATKILRFNYRQQKPEPLQLDSPINQVLRIQSKLKPLNPEPSNRSLEQQSIINQTNFRQSTSLLKESRSKKLSVVSKEVQDREKYMENVEAPLNQNKPSHKISKTQSFILENRNSKVLSSRPSHISVQPIPSPFGCNMNWCEDPQQKQKVDFEPKALNLTPNIKESNVSSQSHRSVKNENEVADTPVIKICEQERKDYAEESFKKQKSSQETRLIRESEQTLEDIQVPQVIAQNWKKISDSEETNREIVIQIAPFVLP